MELGYGSWSNKEQVVSEHVKKSVKYHNELYCL